MSLFRGVPNKTLKAIVPLFTLEEHEAAVKLFDYGMPGDKVYILMHGSVADVLNRAEELVSPLRAAGVAFTAECYGPDPDRALLRELRG